MLILLVWMSSERHTGHTVLRILSAGLILLNKKPHDPQRNHSLLVYDTPPSIIIAAPDECLGYLLPCTGIYSAEGRA